MLRRLNRTEYANAIRDLLALQVEAASLLPPDDSSHGFDNIADVLGGVAVALESYMMAFSCAVTRVLEKVAVLIKLFAMMPMPTRRVYVVFAMAVTASTRRSSSVCASIVHKSSSAVVMAVLLPVVAMPALAQTPYRLALDSYPRTSWTEFESFSLGGVRAITQDGNGYVWLAADVGLVRFDGARFVRWETIGGALPESIVSALYTADDGSVWAGFSGSGGVSRIGEGTVRSYTWRDGMLPGPVSFVHEDGERVLWVGSSFGLARFRRGEWERLDKTHGLPDGPVWDLLEDLEGNLWVTTADSIFRRTKSSHMDKWERVATVSGRGSALVQDGSGAIWIADTAGFRRFRSPEQPVSSRRERTPINMPINSVALFRDRRGYLWIATKEGLLCGLNDEWSAASPFVRLTRKDGLPSDHVLSLFEDREGNIWVGTTGGLSRFSMMSPKQVSRHNAFQGHDVTVVTIDQSGAVWAGTSNGLIRLYKGRVTRFGEREGLPGQYVKALHINQHGTLWVATERGIARLVGNRFLPILEGNTFLKGVSALTTDLEGALWLCDFTGIWVWRDGMLEAVHAEHSRPSSVLVDRKGRVWVGFVTAGVNVYHHRNTVNAYTRDHGLPDAIVTGIHEGSEGVIWITTTKGLVRIKDGRLTSFSGTNGFPDDAVMGLVEDQSGYLWLGTQIGLVRVHPRQFEHATVDPLHRIAYTVLSESDGFENVRWTGAPNSLRDAQGSLWFVTRNGISLVEPAQMGEVHAPNPVRIERVVLDGTASAPSPGMRLRPSVNRVQVDFTSLALVAPSKLQFRYMLEGLDRDWIEAGTQRQAFYTNLQPGSYRLRIATRYLGGEWTTPSYWDFVVLPPIYRTVWFYVVSMLAFATAVYAIWRQRIQRIQKRYALVLGERARIGREIHDTLLQGMVGVALQLEGAAVALESGSSSVRQRIERARDCLEAYTREARTSIWELRSPLLDTHQLPTALRRIGETLINGTGVNFELVIDGEPRRASAMIEQHLLRIAHEAIFNAFRHADATTIRVNLRYESSDIRIRVEDNGHGFDPEGRVNGKPKTLGLMLMRERAEQIGAMYRLVSSAAGTAIDVSVPVTNSL